MTESEHFVGKVSQRAIIEHDGKFLLTLDVGAPHWGAPGGRLHKSEKPLEGLCREVREELGLNIEPGDILYTEVETYTDGTAVFVVYYRACLTDAAQQLMLDPIEVAEAGWYDSAEIKTLSLWPSVAEAIRLSAKNV